MTKDFDSTTLINKWVKLIYSDFKDGQTITITKFGVLISFEGGYASLKYLDGHIEIYGNVIRLLETTEGRD